VSKDRTGKWGGPNGPNNFYSNPGQARRKSIGNEERAFWGGSPWVYTAVQQKKCPERGRGKKGKGKRLDRTIKGDQQEVGCTLE